VYCSTLLALPAASSTTPKAPFGPDSGSRFHLPVVPSWKSSQKYRPLLGQARVGPVSTVTLPVPVTAVVSLPPPAWARAFALTSAAGRGV
jgi:hypothetical protein